MQTFGTYSDSPVHHGFYGQSGWWSVPAGRSWYMVTDSQGRVWASPNAITLTAGVASGSPLFACELDADGTYVFQDMMANRQLGIDSPAPDRLSQFN